eukprot:TRINITY_DN2192_c0_g1_i21.p2 TRINITY_DN2192_c0_g1~~TRINITY_DN2192_c0_g1_i21.p2  ORF type:complete len:186 (+),score=53.42 TRINITY_DN2192_c0_g1_i21:449-1006(+)
MLSRVPLWCQQVRAHHHLSLSLSLSLSVGPQHKGLFSHTLSLALSFSFSPDLTANTTLHPDFFNVIARNTSATASGIQFVTIAPKVLKDATGGLVSGGIIGVYLTIVLSIGRFLRMYVSGIVQRIPLEDMPQTDSLMKDVMDIYLARQDGDFVLEETLYKELIEVYRSTEEMIARSARSGKAKEV